MLDQRRITAVSGDALIAAELERFGVRRSGEVAVVSVDLEADPVIQVASTGAADPGRRFEIGSVTKGLTGMLVADAIERGELALDTRVGDVLAVAATSPLASVTVRELCTHTSGLPRVGWSAARLAVLAPWVAVGLDPYRGVAVPTLLAQAAGAGLAGRGRYRYSNLGGAIAGQMVAAAAGTSYETALAERIFAPLGMSASAVSRRGDTAGWGHSAVGAPREPWVLGAYSPAGGVISTVADIGALLAALLDGSAPGLASLERIPEVATESPARASAMFWVIQVRSRRAPTPFIWHNGASGGYSSFVMLDRRARRGVAVLASVSVAEQQQEIAFAVMDAGRP